MLPLFERHDFAALVGPTALFYGQAVVRRDCIDVLNKLPGSLVLKVFGQLSQLGERLFKKFGHNSSIPDIEQVGILTKRKLCVAKKIRLIAYDVIPSVFETETQCQLINFFQRVEIPTFLVGEND
jgi:hypothetical protein